MKPQFQGHGFITPFIAPEEYLNGKLGAVGKPLRPLSGWKLPIFEAQAIAFETSNCTAFGSLNALEVLQLVKFGEDVNYSDRALGVMAGTNAMGNSPQTVMETIRKGGLAGEESLPWGGENVQEYYLQGKDMPSRVESDTRSWVRHHAFNHEWTFTPFYDKEEKKENLMRQLDFAPVPVSVYAWWKDGEYYRKPEGATANHWCMLFDYEKGKWWAIYDSYKEEVKLLAWDYDFEHAKSIFLEKNVIKKCFLSNWLD